MQPPSISSIEEPLKYREANIPLASAYFSFGTSDCIIDNAIINIERPMPCITLDKIRNDMFMLNPAAAMLIMNIVIIMSNTFFLPYISDNYPAI
jgi:hypothetical protein